MLTSLKQELFIFLLLKNKIKTNIASILAHQRNTESGDLYDILRSETAKMKTAKPCIHSAFFQVSIS